MLGGTETRWVCNGCRQRLLRPSRRKVQLQRLRFQSSLRQPPIQEDEQGFGTPHAPRADPSLKISSDSARPSDLWKLPQTPARTRFAPSPTGYLHLGSLRTALFNYLLARATKGQFVLRIEDTDTKRTVPGALERICQDLKWAGLQWDEGPEVGGPYGPYRQSERTALYQEHAHKLVESGHAYRCFCTPERLLELAKARHEIGLPPGYDRTCSGISKAESDERAHKGEKHAIRFKSAKVYPKFLDLVYGPVGTKASKPGKEQGAEDPILLKSDGFPTYHLANVIDDHHMKITHVIRATEWINSTAKHIAMYQAFGWQPPAFAHVSLLTDLSGNKLSKRKQDIDVASFKEQGYFPDALTNFSALLGWSHKEESDVFNMNELVDVFNLKFTKGNTKVMFKKLDFLQKHHARRIVEEQGARFEKLIDENVAELQQRREADSSWVIPSGRDEREYVKALLYLRLRSAKGSYLSPGQFLDEHQALFKLSITRSEEAPELSISQREHLTLQLVELGKDNWTVEGLRDAKVRAVISLAEARGKRASGEGVGSPAWKKEHKEEADMINKYLRWALLSSSGPETTDVMELLGKDITLQRLKDAEQS